MAGIKGLDSFTDVLEIMKDPAKYEAKLNEIRKATHDYQVVVESVVELSKVNEYTSSIRFREEESKHLLTSAKEQAEKILTDAYNQAGEMKANATSILNEANEAKKENKQLNKELKEQLSDIQAQKNVLATHAAELERKSMALDNLEKELLEKRNKLLNALS